MIQQTVTVPAWATGQVQAHTDAAVKMDGVLPAVLEVAQLLIDRFEAGGVLYTFGNGGSAADAQHLTGELIGRYRRERRPLPAITLSTDATVMTCVGNDYSFDEAFSRQVEALAGPNDVVAGFSTSGRSPNVVKALAAAKQRGATTVLFCGAELGPAAEHADHVLQAPETFTARIQEMHTLMLHLISEHVDAWAAGVDPEV